MNETDQEPLFLIIQLIHKRADDLPEECLPPLCKSYDIAIRIHQILLSHYTQTDEIVHTLFPQNNSNWADNLWQICLSFFPNNDISWRKISHLLAYTVSLYIHMAKQNYNSHRLFDILSVVDAFFDRHLKSWIDSVGGWNSLMHRQNFFVKAISFMYRHIRLLL